jgi:predicted nucleotidyltransferase component of viral defense system
MALMYTNLARLSVDVDLDYVGSLDKDITKRDRIAIMAALDNYMIGEDYVGSSKSRGSSILDSRTYAYTNASGNKDNIKVEINFIDRIHVCQSVRKSVNCFDKEVMVQTLQEEKLFGMKICALIDRCKPRDLFDVNKMKECLSDLDANLLKKMIVFYMSLDGLFEVNETTLDKIRLIDKEDIKRSFYQSCLKQQIRFRRSQRKSNFIFNRIISAHG